AKMAYAPYSKFHVGAALQLVNGTIITGNNQENAAYPSGLCAERTALFYASSQYPKEPIKRIAISCYSENSEFENPISPCGACRQVLAEYEKYTNHPVQIIMAGNGGKVFISDTVSNLLPLTFDRSYLER
ncbi:MAG: cytidine deaminase, partial [Bacteroidia bacterium]